MANASTSPKSSDPISAPEPQTPEGYTERAWSHYSKKEFYRAEADFRKASELKPNNIDILYALGMALEASGRQPESIQTFEKVITLLESAPPEDHNRTVMLDRLSHGHINRMKTGDWHIRE